MDNSSAAVVVIEDDVSSGTGYLSGRFLYFFLSSFLSIQLSSRLVLSLRPFLGSNGCFPSVGWFLDLMHLF